MFTKTEIEEIRRKLAAESAPDSSFEQAEFPLTGDETVAILQDGKNKNVSLRDLYTIGETCRVTVVVTPSGCNPTVTISADGELEKHTDSSGNYYVDVPVGTILTIVSSAAGYLTFSQVFTITSTTTINIHMVPGADNPIWLVCDDQVVLGAAANSSRSVALVSNGSWSSVVNE